ncbi:MAG: hypothetical protein ABSD59_21995 [Terracidiphilus sp.]
MQLWAGAGLAVLLALVCGLTGRSQSNGGGGGMGQGNGNAHPFSPHQDLGTMVAGGDDNPLMMERRVRTLNIQRQKQMVSDSDKLLKLARELNEEVAARNAGTLTPEELRKIAEIEKLAHNVKQRMTDGVGQPAETLPPTSAIFPNR